MSQQTSLSRNQTASQGLEQPKAVTRSVPAMAGNHPSNWPSAGRVMPPSGHSNESTRGPSQTLDNGGLTEGVAGVVFVQGATTGPNFVNFLAKEIHEGPIYEFRVLSEDRALIIFLYELHAQVFLDRNREALAITGESVYGPAYTLEAGEPLEWHATLRRMVYPLRERRRLTFARAGLFGDKLTPQKWAQDVRDIAGKGNVEYTWVFNNGNGKAMPLKLKDLLTD
ncbi:hypothetical protein VTN31DRAFT_6453 [Thermomyces dupontii]|uniref:uncharacterized protein n=1 Tax=Talaromyces thermophilus TaxID=28565 RepID=UPI0037445934